MPTPDTAHTPLTSTSLHPPSYRGWLNLQAIAEGQSTSDAARAHAEDCKAQAPAGGEGLGGLKGGQTTVAAPFNRTAGERDDLGDCGKWTTPGGCHSDSSTIPNKSKLAHNFLPDTLPRQPAAGSHGTL
ncbi:hypothetical protein H0H92_012963 [Tricholoma furcatifolium]|nr:hypothetical protein H0H92_012963 [Tricholoma furcatifolium]